MLTGPSIRADRPIGRLKVLSADGEQPDIAASDHANSTVGRADLSLTKDRSSFMKRLVTANASKGMLQAPAERQLEEMAEHS
jgi:hypothetical protein